MSDDPNQARDAFSSAFLPATATRLIRDVAVLGHRESPAAFRGFTEELASQVAALAAKYDISSAKSRRFRVVLGSHPVVTKTAAEGAAETARHIANPDAHPDRKSGRKPRRNIARRA